MGIVVIIIIIAIVSIIQFAKQTEKRQSDKREKPKIKHVISQVPAKDDNKTIDRSMIERSGDGKAPLFKTSQQAEETASFLGAKKQVHQAGHEVFSKQKIAEAFILAECLSKPRAKNPHYAVDKNRRKA
ncbi:hypothetical protein EV207_101322 [Scopulibacillus darangshiensis]|uniref:Uncharacterized protein n=1 Tax=Scopulibacillus darangshiensis TaxID=442528 RepID=A0A4R2PB59_9BACL|nr:hypothetical protein [Scopulibacillus darangshiensis]TCP32343.1 hypothetical protein EV207_101322 [Scopulibacillus darangshiensis]